MLTLMILKIIFQPQNFIKMIPIDYGFKKVNDIQLYYEMYGSGKPLVLIHGGGGSILNDFKEVIPQLAQHFKIIGIDLQNHGRSEHRYIPETFEQDADDISEILLQLHIKKASFLGFSNGGNTVMQIAYKYPEIVDKLVLCSSFYKKEGMLQGFFDDFESPTIDMMPTSLKENFLKLNPSQEKLLNMFEKDSTRMKNFKNWDEAILKSIQAKTLLINGNQDIVLPEHTQEMKHLIPNSEILLLDATHGSYLMADFENRLDNNLIENTAEKIIYFLED